YPAVSVLEHLGLALKEGAPIRLVSWESGGHRPVYFDALRANFEAFVAGTRRPDPVRPLDWELAEPCRVGWVEVLELGAGPADAPAMPDLNVMSTPGRVRLGVNVDRAFAGPGVKVAVVVKGTTAEKIGMRTDDVIVGLDGAAIADLGALGAALGRKTFDTDIAVRVRRGDKDIDLRGRIPAFVSRPYYARAKPTARVSVRMTEDGIDVVTRHVKKLRLSLTSAAAALPVLWNGRPVDAEPTSLSLKQIATRYAAHADAGRLFEAELVLDEAAFAATVKPRLVVVISIDQLRPDTWTRFRDEYTGGLKRLLVGGARFDGLIDHAATQTGPGHATMLTGCHPGKAGIVANNWLDPKTLEKVYCVGDKKHGRSHALLLRTGLGDWMKKADARAQVYSVSAKDRSAVLMGGKGPDGAFWLDKATGFTTSGAYGEAPAWLTAFNNDGWIEKLPEHWTYKPDPRLRADDDPRESPRFKRASPHPLRAATRKKTLDHVYRSPYMDSFTLRLATELVRRFDLGGDEVSDLLCIGLSATDTIGHLYGPRSQEVRDSTLRLDKELGAFFAMLDKRGAPWVLALTADHGVLPLDELKRINLVRFFARVESDLKKRVGHAALLRQAGGVVYLDRARIAELGLDAKKVAHEAAEAFRAREGVHAVFVTSELDTAKGDLGRLVRNSFHPERSGDLIVVQKHGYLPDLYGTGTSHGSPWEYDRSVPLVFYGPGVREGERGPGRTIDIAPSLARLLGVAPPPGVDGRDLGLK
ncbi:MAG: alkaline phosphatase family protein, partial [Planctomycetota bacterium]|nr:alkaline phosphatase family protein [Planctomycetota bacterium]